MFLGGGNGKKRTAENLFQRGAVYAYALCPRLVLHVERHHDGYVEFKELTCQEKISFEICGVHDVDNQVGAVVVYVVVGNLFVDR